MRLFSSALTNYRVVMQWGHKTGAVGYLHLTTRGAMLGVRRVTAVTRLTGFGRRPLLMGGHRAAGYAQTIKRPLKTAMARIASGWTANYNRTLQVRMRPAVVVIRLSSTLPSVSGSRFQNLGDESGTIPLLLHHAAYAP